ncbi:MAG: hypothetical protein ACP5QZ_02530 [Candidatus Sumerlaeaceae bacterium]
MRPMSICAVVAALACAVLSGCSASPREIQRLDPGEVRPARPPRSVELLTKAPDRPYREIAVVDSFRAKKLDPEVTARMMEDLQKKAARFGADAVVDVRRLADRHEGFVNNPRTPFPSLMQGQWKTYFFRGRAIRYINR